MKELLIDTEFQDLIPSFEEREQLEASLIAEGCRDALVVWDNRIVDGHNRYAICQKHGIEFQTVERAFADRDAAKVWIIQNQFARRNLNAWQRSKLALILKPLIAAKAKEKQREHGNTAPGRPKTLSQKSDEVSTKKELAKAAGVSHDTIAKADKIQKEATPEQKEKLEKSETSINQVYKQVRTKERRQEKVEKLKAISEKPVESLEALRQYPVIYADPPWQYEHCQSDNRKIENQYPTMSLDGICNLKVSDITTDDCILFMWATSPKLAEAMRVIESWGFNYRTCMVWVKESPSVGQFELQTPDRQGYSREAHLYRNGYAVKEVANLMRRPESTIRYWLNNQGIELEPHREVINRESLTDRQHQILDGEMLGDGCLAKGIRNKNARLQWNLKSLGHTQLLADEFSEFEPVYKERKDREGWSLWTRVNQELSSQHIRWYINKIKTVPRDLQLTPLICFHWYIGDGYLQKSGGIDLCTHGFTRSDNEFLVQRLDEIDIDAKILTKKDGSNYIVLGKLAAQKFLAYIGHCRVVDYAYKWGDSDKVLFGTQHWGMGYYARQRHELLLIATKGSIPTPLPENRPDSVVESPREEHSKKPDRVYEIIERMYPELPKIELFARQKREGWMVWGNQSA